MGDSRRKRQRQSTRDLRVNRLVIIEWLPAHEEQTGTRLYERLLAREGQSIPVEVVRCASRADVLSAIKTVEDTIPTRGVPVLHIEAHGLVDGSGSAVGFAGPDSADNLRWSD